MYGSAVPPACTYLMETEPSPTRALKVNLVLIQIVFPAHLFFFNHAGKHKIWVQQSGNRLLQINTQQRTIEQVTDFFPGRTSLYCRATKPGRRFVYTVTSQQRQKKIALSRKGEGKNMPTLYTAPIENLSGMFAKMRGKEIWLFKMGTFIRLNQEGRR